MKAIIFDLDGILIDTERFQWQAWVEVLKPLNIYLSKEDYFNYAGKTGTIIEKELIEKYNLKAKGLLKKKEELLLKWFRSKPIKLMLYARESIKFFADRGIKFAICSGGPKNEVLLKLRRCDLKVDIVVTRSDVKRGKPYPDIYLLAAKLLGVEPKECVVIEDTQYGLESAKSAGMLCLVIPNEFSKKQDFSRADAILNNLKEAVAWIEKNYELPKH